MHELSIAQSMFGLVLEQAKKADASKVVNINLVIGEMTGVVVESVQFYLDFLGKGTAAEKAALNIKKVPAQATCRACHRTFELPEFERTCPYCKEEGLEITGGTELFLESIEVE
jgi:hydrogenase nickel incorporation protein HypA/HybF